MTAPKTTLAIVPPDPGGKTKHLVLITHRGGGWYEAACMGEAKACREGDCSHSRDMVWQGSPRPIRQVARDCRETTT